MNDGDDMRLTKAPLVFLAVEPGIEGDPRATDRETQRCRKGRELPDGIRQQERIMLVHRSHDERCDDIAVIVDNRELFQAFLVLVPGVAEALAPFLAMVFEPSP